MQDTPPDLLLNPFSTLLCVLGQPLCSYIKGLPSPLASSWVWPMGRLHSRLKGGLRVTSGCLLPSFPSSGFDSNWCVLNVTVPFLRASPDNSYFGFQKKQCLFKTLFIFPNLSVSSMYCPGPLYKDALNPIARMSHTASPRYQEGWLGSCYPAPALLWKRGHKFQGTVCCLGHTTDPTASTNSQLQPNHPASICLVNPGPCTCWSPCLQCCPSQFQFGLLLTLLGPVLPLVSPYSHCSHGSQT